MTNNDKQASFPDGKNLAGESPEVLRTKDYEPPVTRRTSVEVEGGVCDDPSIVPDEPNTEEQNITIDKQEIGSIGFYDGTDASDGGWDY